MMTLTLTIIQHSPSLADPFFTTILRDSKFSVVRFPSGNLSSCLTYDLDRARAVYLSPGAPASRPQHRPPTPRFVLDTPPQESSSAPPTAHDDITYALSTASLLPCRSSAPTPIMPTPTTRPPLPHLGLPDVPWGSDPPHIAAPPVQQGWKMPQWGNADDPHGTGPEPEPPAWGSRRSPSPSSSDSHLAADIEDEFPLYHYTQTSSSFKGGTTVNATGHIRDPLNTRYPLSTAPC
jgi:hypothetical protein